MSNIKCQMSSRLNFCRSVPLEFLQSFLTSLLCIFHWHLYWHVIISWKIQWGVGRWCHSQEHLLSRPIYVIFMWDTCQIYVIFMSHTYHCPIHVTCISRLCHINCRWQIQRGVGVIPKSVFPNELSDNLGVWGWTLNQDDMEVFMNMIIVIVIICCEKSLPLPLPLSLPLPGDKPNGDRSAKDSSPHHVARGRAEDQGHRRHQLPLWLHGGRQRLKDDLRWDFLRWNCWQECRLLINKFLHRFHHEFGCL